MLTIFKGHLQIFHEKNKTKKHMPTFKTFRSSADITKHFPSLNNDNKLLIVIRKPCRYLHGEVTDLQNIITINKHLWINKTSYQTQLNQERKLWWGVGEERIWGNRVKGITSEGRLNKRKRKLGWGWGEEVGIQTHYFISLKETEVVTRRYKG